MMGDGGAYDHVCALRAMTSIGRPPPLGGAQKLSLHVLEYTDKHCN